jgi:hypothetical protein
MTVRIDANICVSWNAALPASLFFDDRAVPRLMASVAAAGSSRWPIHFSQRSFHVMHILSSHARLLTAAVAVFASASALAQGGAPSGLERIGRGTPTTCACIASSDAGSANATPGPYAKYLINQGMSKEQALEAARGIDAGQAAAADGLRRRDDARAAAAR